MWSRDPRALWRRCGEQVLVLAPAEEDLLVLGGTGQHTWELLDEPIDDMELTATLARAYDTDAAIVGQQLRPFLEQLTRAGAVARSG